MKKNSKDKNVVRAMVIGITAMMTLSEPMAVLAQENEGLDSNNDNNTLENNQAEAEHTAAAQDAVDNVVTETKEAEKAEQDIKNDILSGENQVNAGEVVVEKEVTSEQGTVTEKVDLSQEIINMAKEDSTDESGATDTTVETEMENVSDQLEIAESEKALAEKEVTNAENAVDTAENAAEDMNTIVDDAMDEVETQTENISNATTVEEANDAYASIEKTVADAQTDFDNKLQEYNDAKAAYEDAVKKAEDYKAAYDLALATAGANVEAAEAELTAATERVAELKAAVEAANAEAGKSAAGALDIAEKEKIAREDGGLNWRNEDALFISIMQNYYLPEKESITGATVTRVQGKDNDSYNYFKAVYTDENGNEQVAYYNYKMDGNSKDDIVIFEKREVEIFGDPNETPDRYVDSDGNVKNIEEGLENGSIIAIVGEDGKTRYYEKNDATSSETLVSDSEITSTSKEDTTIVEDSKSETYKLDDDGNLVKEVTADVTTVTYTGATFTSDDSFTTADARDAAAAEKEAELEEATGKDATVENTESTTYVATGTFIPTFTKTIDVNIEVEKKNGKHDPGVKTEAEAVNSVKTEAEDKVTKGINGDWYLIDVSSDLAVTGYTEDTWYDDSDFIVTGTATATYAKVTKQDIDFSTWQEIGSWFNGEKLEAIAKKWVQDNGGIYVGSSSWNWNFKTATISYVAAMEVTGETADSEVAAKESLEDAIKKALAELEGKDGSAATGAYQKKVDTESTTQYSYQINYLEKASTTTNNKIIATETYGNTDQLTGEIIQNLNYIQGNILLTQNNVEYRAFVDDAKALTEKYNALLAEAETAQAEYQEAQAAVEALEDEITKLKETSIDISRLTELEAELAAAEVSKTEAETKLQELNAQLEDAADLLDTVVAALTPDEEEGTGSETNPGTPGAPTTPTTPTTPGTGTGSETTAGIESNGGTIVGGGSTTGTAGGTTTLATTIEDEPVALAAAPTATVVANANTTQNQEDTDDADNADETMVIEDEETPLAAGEDASNEETSEDGALTIEDEETPLADSMEAEKETMSWWWLLIVAVLGATGYELYRRNKMKKETAKVEKK